ncbi:MAG: hypothetical protein LBN32_01050 [Helicobacteraceae bacterium]|jgi:hypothetical protein|nr:hypothetical protein [Helicobacteraceae bacterium]
MNDSLLALTIAILCALLLMSIVIILMHLKSKAAFGAEAQEGAPNAQRATSKKARGNKNGKLIVGDREFEFSYSVINSDDVKRQIGLIKHSLALLKESKYPDIIASRAKECEALISKLDTITTLNKSAIDDILANLKAHVNSLRAAM